MADIECGYCRAMNDKEERRCTRCGRRLLMASPRPAPESYSVGGGGWGAATAPAIVPRAVSFPEHFAQSLSEQALPERTVPEQLKNAPDRVTYQPSLFRDGQGSQKVIPIPTLTPLRGSRESTREGPAIRRSAPRNAPAPRV